MTKNLLFQLLSLLCSSFILTKAITVTNPADLLHTSSFGAFYEVEDGQLLYEATAPVIYTVRLPNWLNFFILPEKVQNCSVETNPTKSSSCEIYKAFSEIANAIRSSLQTTPSTFPSVTKESTWGLRCNYISKHFSSSFITPAIVQKYMGFLRTCSDGVIIEEPLISDFSKFPDATIYQQFDQLWNSGFFSRFNESTFPENLKTLLEVVETGETESILSLGVTSFVAEAIRWNMALAKCGTGHIPDSIITPERFYESLQKLNKTADAAGFRFVIPPKDGFLPVYFKSEFLTDCSISVSPSEENDNASQQSMDLMVRTLVPIVKKDANWKHVTVKSLKFIANKTKVVMYPEFLLNIQEETSTFIYDNSSKLLFSSDANLCDVTKPGFCRIPQIWDARRIVRSNCPMELVSDQLHVNSTNCKERREVPATEFQGLPFIVKEGSHMFYLTGIRDESVNYDLSVTCSNGKGNPEIKETFYYVFPDEGALQIKLACECKLQVTKFNTAVIRPELGCSPTLDVSVVLPA